MAKGSDDLDLSDRQKTRLLSLALNADDQEASPGGEEERGDLLCDILRCPLPNGGFVLDVRSLGTRTSHPTLRFVCGPPIQELLQAPETDVSVLRRIKEYAKVLGTRAESGVEKDVFLAVYFAAIAAAMVSHSERITEHSDDDLAQFFDCFARAPWISTDVAGLFKRAKESRRARSRRGV